MLQCAIAYYRVSTQRQGRSGLGQEAQRAAVNRFAESEGISIAAEFTILKICSDPKMSCLLFDSDQSHLTEPAQRYSS